MRLRKQKTAQTVEKQNRGLLFILLFAAAVFIGIGGMRVRAALESDKSSGIRSVNVQDSQIGQATLVIGSHLIHINGLTDELYETALKSANEFNQQKMYYKSELADGAWFEISEAVSIADITTAGSPVSKSVIEELEFTHMTDQNGITTDLRNGQVISVFDINSPYDLNTLEELEPLRTQYQILQEKTDKNKSDEIYLNMIRKLFEKNIRTEQTKECDASLNGLEAYKGSIISREKPSMWVEKTENIMTSVDAERRVLSLSMLGEYLDELENDASGMGASIKSENAEDGEEQEIPDFIVNSEIVSAVGDSIKNVEESISAYEAKRMTDQGETASAKTEYRYSRELIVSARATDTAGCDKIMEMLCDLQNILDDVIADQDRELSALTSELVNAAFQKYAEDLRAGVSPEYQTALSEGASKAVLSKYLTQQKSAANADRLEYQTMLSAQLKRMGNEQAQQYTLQLIDGVSELLALVKADAAESYLKETVDAHLLWLRSSYADLVADAADDTQISSLEKEKEELSKKYQDALDQNDLALAGKLKAEIEAKQKEIDALTKELNDILNSPNSSEADKAKAKAALGNTSAASQISRLADQLEEEIYLADGSSGGAGTGAGNSGAGSAGGNGASLGDNSGGADTGNAGAAGTGAGNGAGGGSNSSNSTDLQNQLTALAAAAELDPDAGAAALAQIKEAVENSTGLSESDLSALGNTLSEAEENIKEAQKNQGGMLSEDALKSRMEEILNELFGSGFAKASSVQQAGAILAMEWYGEEKESDAALLTAASLTKQAQESGNAFIYPQYKEQKEAYLSLQTLGNVLSYRYIFDNKHSTVTLKKGNSYYLFTLGSMEYQEEGGAKKLKALPKLSGTFYIHGNDSSRIFDTKAEYIKKTQYALAGTPQAETLAKEIYDKLLEGGA